MLIKNLTVSGLLSFGPEGVDIEMRDLNVLIGPNGSGKSNFLEVLSLLHATPASLASATRNGGRISDWFWHPSRSTGRFASIQSRLEFSTEGELEHDLDLVQRGDTILVEREKIAAPSTSGEQDEIIHVDRNPEGASVRDVRGNFSQFSTGIVQPNESILSLFRAPTGQFPSLDSLHRAYGRIKLFRSWQFGPAARVRQPQGTDLPTDLPMEQGENIALLVSNMSGIQRADLANSLCELIPGIEEVRVITTGGLAQLFLNEGDALVPATRLSDGTLRYLCLLAILLDPNPPGLIAIEEPELGLHPDVLPTLGKLIKLASSRMQVVITTHSQVLLDTFSSSPEDVVVCSRGKAGSDFERLDGKKLDIWLKDHRLGDLWSMGQIGGNRW